MIRKAGLMLLVCVASCTLGFGQGPAYPYSVPNNWTASIDKVAGYNLYRAVQTGAGCGPFTKINTALIAGTSFTDTTVADVITYCYAATAVGLNNSESGFSNIQQNIAIAPAPPTAFGATVAKLNGQDDVTAKWVQSKDSGITANDLYAGLKAGGPYNALHLKLEPSTTATYKNAPKGNYFAIVTATAKSGESGRSNEIKISVP